MKTRTLGLLVLTVLLAGCWQKSVHPFYTEQDVITDPRLIGTWTEETESDGNRTTWTFQDMGDRRIEVVVQDKNVRHEFEARLFKLGDVRFLDFVGKGHGLSVIPAHHLFRVVALGDELKLAPLNTDWVQKWLRQNPSVPQLVLPDPEHRDNRDKDELVLAADTKALQKFVREHMNDKDFFAEPTGLQK